MARLIPQMVGETRTSDTVLSAVELPLRVVGPGYQTSADRNMRKGGRTAKPSPIAYPSGGRVRRVPSPKVINEAEGSKPFGLYSFSDCRNLLAVIARAPSPSLPPHGRRSGFLFTSALRLLRKGLSAFNSGILFHHNSAFVVSQLIRANSSQSPSQWVNCAVMSLSPIMTGLLDLRAFGFHTGSRHRQISLGVNFPSHGIHFGIAGPRCRHKIR